MTLHTTLKAAGLCIALIATHASAQIISASNAGQYSSTGDYSAGNTNYVTGAFEAEYRSFFVFHLPVFTQPIISAKLDLFNFGGSDDIPAGYYSDDSTETLSFFKVSTSIPTLIAGGSGLTGIFSDLGTGPAYGSTTVSSASNGQYVSLFLNSAFLADLNAASGGSIALGGALMSLADPNGYEFVFGNTDLSSANPAVRLTLVAGTASNIPVPEPSTYGLFAVGALALGAIRRRMNRRNV
jgi:hypothetical protein